MKSLSLLVGLLSLGMLWQGCDALSASKVQLQLQPEVGEKFEMSLVSKMEMMMTGNDTKSSSMRIDAAMEVLDKSDSTVSIKTTFQDLSMDMPGLGGVSINLSEMMEALRGKDVVLRLNSQGEIQSIDGIEQLFTEENPMRQSVKQLLTQSFDQSMAFLPKEPVKVGSIWNSYTEQRQQGAPPLKIRNTWKLEKVEGDLAHLSVQSSIDEQAGPAGEGTSISQEGSLQVSLATGLTQKGLLNQATTVNMGLAEMKAKSSVEITTKEL